MRIIQNEIRPVGYITLELSENEVKSIVGVFEEICHIKNMPYESIIGTRAEIYNKLCEVLKTTNYE